MVVFEFRAFGGVQSAFEVFSGGEERVLAVVFVLDLAKTVVAEDQVLFDHKLSSSQLFKDLLRLAA